MSTKIISGRPDDDLARAEKLMRDAQVRRLPVVDSDGRLIGLHAVAELDQLIAEG